MDVPFTGGCRCGVIRYVCRAEPRVVFCCHCTDCQRTSGGPFSTGLVVPAEAFTLVSGEPRGYTLQGESGGYITREFCGACGSPLFGVLSAAPEVRIIRFDSLDDRSQARPGVHIWTDSALPWTLYGEDATRFPRGFQR